MPLTLTADPAPLAVDADGVIRVGATRVTLDTVVAAFRDGLSAEAIVEQYPVLALGDAYAAIAYYLRHQADVSAYLDQRARVAASTRCENEALHPPTGLRVRLLSRRRPQGMPS